jgi:hypothetical protein
LADSKVGRELTFDSLAILIKGQRSRHPLCSRGFDAEMAPSNKHLDCCEQGQDAEDGYHPMRNNLKHQDYNRI